MNLTLQEYWFNNLGLFRPTYWLIVKVYLKYLNFRYVCMLELLSNPAPLFHFLKYSSYYKKKTRKAEGGGFNHSCAGAFD